MSSIVSLLGWTFLPNLVTSWTQTIYYGITIRAGDPKPTRGTARWAQHRRRIYILVVSLYLLYTLYEAHAEMRAEGSFYTDLSVPPSATEREVRSRFRRLAALYHPDKIKSRGGGTAGDEETAHDRFVQLKVAAETLADPAKRFAYDRFGAEVVEWTDCVTPRDYVFKGLQHVLPYYGIAATAMFLLGLMGYLDWGKWWRWVTLVSVLVFELHAVSRPSWPWILDRVVNPVAARLASSSSGGGGGGRGAGAAAAGMYTIVPFQAVALLRQASVTLFVAFSQIGPMLTADASSGKIVMEGERASGKGGASEEELAQQGLQRVENAVAGLDADAKRLLEMEMAPFVGDAEAVKSVQLRMKEWLVQNTIRADPMVRDALGRSLQKRRVDAPAGAKGTK